jgi:hypothetical protein
MKKGAKDILIKQNTTLFLHICTCAWINQTCIWTIFHSHTDVISHPDEYPYGLLGLQCFCIVFCIHCICTLVAREPDDVFSSHLLLQMCNHRARIFQIFPLCERNICNVNEVSKASKKCKIQKTTRICNRVINVHRQESFTWSKQQYFFKTRLPVENLDKASSAHTIIDSF